MVFTGVEAELYIIFTLIIIIKIINILKIIKIKPL